MARIKGSKISEESRKPADGRYKDPNSQKSQKKISNNLNKKLRSKGF